MINVKRQEEAIKRSTSNYVTEVLRKAIITREFAQGRRLVESEIAKDLNVSITPVRHAFMQLSKEGLIEIYPYRGSYVTKITSQLVSDMAICRTMLEPEAAYYAYDHFIETDAEYLLKLVNEANQEYQKNEDIYQLLLRDVNFHKSIIIFSQNKIMLDMWEAINYRVLLLQSYAKEGQEFQISQFINNHIDVAQALAEKKGKMEFVEAVRANMMQVKSNIYIYI